MQWLPGLKPSYLEGHHREGATDMIAGGSCSVELLEGESVTISQFI